MIKLEILRERFSTEEACLEYLAKLKWNAGYSCPKCGNETYCKGRTRVFRKCKKCHFDESLFNFGNRSERPLIKYPGYQVLYRIRSLMTTWAYRLKLMINSLIRYGVVSWRLMEK
jgi:hypothetical protein